MKLVIALSAALLGGCAASPAAAPAARSPWAAYPCLSASLPCGKIATRAPVQKLPAMQVKGDPEKGRAIAQARDRGNCLACHVFKDGSQPGSRGPDLSRYGSLGRSDGETFSLIYDMRTRNRDTLMPPFGTNEVLSEEEILHVVAYLQSAR